MRRPANPRRILAITLALCLARMGGGDERQFHVVSVHGTRVHLRSQLPLQLDHGGVKRHLRPGETFYVERVGYGLSWTGRGMDDTWYYIRSLSDRNDHGWAHSRFLVQLPGHYSADWIETVPASAPVSSTSTPTGLSRATESSTPKMPRPIVNGAPRPFRTWNVDVLDNLLSIANSVVQLIVTFASILGISWLMGVRPVRLDTTHALAQPPVASHPAVTGGARRSANFVYGRRWKIAATLTVREEKRW